MTERELSMDLLRECVDSAAAIRRVARLQPAGGPGDKIFPATYEGGKYADEHRRIEGTTLPCVVVDSVQSQANRLELCLLDAHHAKPFLPLIEVDFSETSVAEHGVVSVLEAPHRLADAILRDSLLGDVAFRKTPAGKALDTASTRYATELFRYCPTALLFGVWDSSGEHGGLGAKFARALVSELVAVNTVTGMRSASRIDPLGIPSSAGPLLEGTDGSWTFDEAEAKRDAKKNPIKFGGDGKPSQANHGNVTPTLSSPGGVTCDYVLHTAVLSLPALRRLHFPKSIKDTARSTPEARSRDTACRTVLAALGIYGIVALAARGVDLRSRCTLVGDLGSPARLELLGNDGSVALLRCDEAGARALLEAAIAELAKHGVPWSRETTQLRPSPKLVKLLEKSRQ